MIHSAKGFLPPHFLFDVSFLFILAERPNRTGIEFNVQSKLSSLQCQKSNLFLVGGPAYVAAVGLLTPGRMGVISNDCNSWALSTMPQSTHLDPVPV